ncbi:MAG: phosphate transport system regulatory protein PhoU [Chloroflexi bacterium RBG_16_64_43]|nr:MAG: phosphate transport system regulatory protein PhoU [Chloroflexi bacterium RBG_16_64_43]
MPNAIGSPEKRRVRLERDIARLNEDLLALGSIVEQATLEAVESLKQRDFETSRRIVRDDREINRRRFAIEEAVLAVIATQQPVAHDLRHLTAVLDVVTELERMGDYAKGIAEINLRIGEKPLIKPLIDVPRMAEKAVAMLHSALGAFVAGDAVRAREVPNADDEVDQLYNQVYNELVMYMISDPRTIDGATYLLWVAHNLERLADRVTNICERTIFLVTGEQLEMDSEGDFA